MIKTYSYLKTTHSQLHEFVMAFFDRIEFETGPFSETFYVAEFWNNVVTHHPGILNKRFKFIYESMKDWNQGRKSSFIKSIRDSNDIESICSGSIRPLKDINIPSRFRQETKDLFRDLYETVLKKKGYFSTSYGLIAEHYKLFQAHKSNKLEYCPACGIWPLFAAEEGRDQYDHYLPKEDYPFSAVNFKNLIPICGKCNTFEVKSNKDILGFTGVVIYPFDEKHKGIDIDVKIAKEDVNDISKTKWSISYSNKDGKAKEIDAWKKIYNIDERHQKHVSGHIEQWYKHYHEHITDSDSIREIPNEVERRENYLRPIKKRRYLEYSALNELIMSFDSRARSVATTYSRF